MQHVDVNGTRLAYVERGTGEPIVFVHGVLNDLRSWEQQIEAFGSSYRAVALSCRHYYPNPPIADDAALSLDTLVEDLAAFLRALRLAPAHLVGASNGAVVCLRLALAHRRLMRTLVLAEPPLLPLLGVSLPPRPSQILRLLVRDPRAAMAVVRFGATTIGPARRAFARGDDEQGVQIFAAGVLGRQAAAGMSHAMRQQSRDNVTAFKARLRAGFPPVGPDDVRRIDVPTLLVSGAHSAPILHRIGDTLQRLLPRAERHEIRHASHLMYETHADVFNAAVLEFLARHAAMQS